MQFPKVGGIKKPEEWIAKSPMYRLSSIEPPVRLEAHDPSSAVATRKMYWLLRSANRPVDFIYFPKGNHILFSPQTAWVLKVAMSIGSVSGCKDWRIPIPQRPSNTSVGEICEDNTKLTSASSTRPRPYRPPEALPRRRKLKQLAQNSTIAGCCAYWL